MSTHPKFVHLHVHTCMSFYESVICVSPLVDELQMRHFDACAVTDRGNVLAAPFFCREALDRGIKPIVGCELDVYDDAYQGENAVRPMGRPRSLVLLVQNDEGWRNLCLVFEESEPGPVPWMPMKRLRHYTRGLVGISRCVRSDDETVKETWTFPTLDAETAALTMAAAFRPGHFFVELLRREGCSDDAATGELLTIAKRNDIPVVATADCRALRTSDLWLLDVMHRLRDGRVEVGMRRAEAGVLLPAKDMVALFHDVPDAVANTRRIASMCSFVLARKKARPPRYDLPRNLDPFEVLETRAGEALERRVAGIEGVETKAYKDRLGLELERIRGAGAVEAALLLTDLAALGAEHDAPMLADGGFFGGTLFAWALRLSLVDPLRFGLEWPLPLVLAKDPPGSLDVMVCSAGISGVEEGLKHMFGPSRLAHPIELESLRCPALLFDLCRVLGLPTVDLEQAVSATVGEAGSMSLFKQDLDPGFPALATFLANHPDHRTVFEAVQSLDTMPIASFVDRRRLLLLEPGRFDTLPANGTENGIPVVRLDACNASTLGIFHFRLSRSAPITQLHKTALFAKVRTGRPVLDNISFREVEVFRRFAEGDTDGVPMCMSISRREMLKRMQPASITDLAVYMLCRWGTNASAGFIDRYCGGGVAHLPRPLRPYLADTRGLLVFDDQLVRIATGLAGYSVEAAFELVEEIRSVRREGVRTELVNGLRLTSRMNVDEAVAIFEAIIAPENCTHDRADALADALLAYTMMWLKVHHPEDFEHVRSSLESTAAAPAPGRGPDSGEV